MANLARILSVSTLSILISGCITSPVHYPAPVTYSYPYSDHQDNDKDRAQYKHPDQYGSEIRYRKKAPYSDETDYQDYAEDTDTRRRSAYNDEREQDRSARHGDALIVGNPYTVHGKTYVPRHQPRYKAVGMASWSGSKHQGRTTALGEPFDKNTLTAAHTTLPLNSLVEVTNLSNGRVVTVKINDRGPFKSDRIINLTERAAHELGFLSSGLAKVRVEYVGIAPIFLTAMYEPN